MLCLGAGEPDGTVIARWPDGKRAALTIRFDGGSINQFRVAAPLLDRLELPATFFVITGDIGGRATAAASLVDRLKTSSARRPRCRRAGTTWE